MSGIKRVHVIYKTHLDIGYTNMGQTVLDSYVQEHIPHAIDLALKINTSEHKKFIWTVGSFLVDYYKRHATPEQLEKMDEAILNYIKSEYNLLIGERTAEEVKIGIGSAIPLKRRETVMVRGRDLITGLPHMIEISNDEITEALKEPLQTILQNLMTCLENTPPELASDIMERGGVTYVIVRRGKGGKYQEQKVLPED